MMFLLSYKKSNQNYVTVFFSVCMNVVLDNYYMILLLSIQDWALLNKHLAIVHNNFFFHWTYCMNPVERQRGNIGVSYQLNMGMPFAKSVT